MKTTDIYETAEGMLKAADLVPCETIPSCNGFEGQTYRFSTPNEAARAVSALSLLSLHCDRYPYFRVDFLVRPGNYTVTVSEGDQEWDDR